MTCRPRTSGSGEKRVNIRAGEQELESFVVFKLLVIRQRENSRLNCTGTAWTQAKLGEECGEPRKDAGF